MKLVSLLYVQEMFLIVFYIVLTLFYVWVIESFHNTSCSQFYFINLFFISFVLLLGILI